MSKKKKRIVLKSEMFTICYKKLEITRYLKRGGIRDVISGFKNKNELTNYVINHQK